MQTKESFLFRPHLSSHHEIDWLSHKGISMALHSRVLQMMTNQQWLETLQPITSGKMTANHRGVMLITGKEPKLN
jgi:hypothetical protein